MCQRLESPIRSARSRDTSSFSTKKSNKSILQNRGLPTPRNSRSLSTEFNRDLATLWQEAYDTTAFMPVNLPIRQLLLRRAIHLSHQSPFPQLPQRLRQQHLCQQLTSSMTIPGI